MEMDIAYDCSGVDWQSVADTLKLVGMAYDEPEVHKKAFHASYATVFVYHASRLIGFGRAISDGVYQAALYDIAVLPEFQGMGVGKLILNKILDAVAGCNVILYASPGKEDFYRKQGFQKMKTGMALFRNAETMAERGFTE